MVLEVATLHSGYARGEALIHMQLHRDQEVCVHCCATTGMAVMGHVHTGLYPAPRCPLCKTGTSWFEGGVVRTRIHQRSSDVVMTHDIEAAMDEHCC